MADERRKATLCGAVLSFFYHFIAPVYEDRQVPLFFVRLFLLRDRLFLWCSTILLASELRFVQILPIIRWEGASNFLFLS